MLGNGYDGQKMSNNAVTAYQNGEMPYSKWTKKVIIEELSEIVSDENVKFFKQFSLDFLRTHVLKNSSWHHTGKFYNQTDFYTLDEKFIEKILNDKDFYVKRFNDNKGRQALDRKVSKKFPKDEKRIDLAYQAYNFGLSDVIMNEEVDTESIAKMIKEAKNKKDRL